MSIDWKYTKVRTEITKEKLNKMQKVCTWLKSLEVTIHLTSWWYLNTEHHDSELPIHVSHEHYDRHGYSQITKFTRIFYLNIIQKRILEM